MSTYTPPLDDIAFALRHIASVDDLAQLPAWSDIGIDHTEDLLAEAGRLAAEVMAPINRMGDEVGSVLDANGDVITPEGFRQAYQQYIQSGWTAVSAQPEHGGAGFPLVVDVAIQEMFTSANMAFSLCPMLSQSAIGALSAHGSSEQKNRWLPPLTSGNWTGTMLLTEPQAGSDVGALTTRAEPQGDGSYRLWGQKIFITWGDHDMADNIVHIVLARTPDAPKGTRGISLFIVPKYLVDDDGTLAERNAIRCIGLEHKVGIHASPTCVMELDGAVGELVGEECEGMRLMFTMMNKARMLVGLEGLAVAERAYQQAAAFAADRRQGRRADTEPGVQAPIVQHPDVRRMLLDMRARTEAMRGLLLLNAAAADRAAGHPDPDQRQQALQRAELLTPVSKAWCTDQGVEVASLGIQVHGGMGYIEETGAAQHWRDSRIAPIYEGTNGIQAIDLVGRKLPMADGAPLTSLLEEMTGLDKNLDQAVAAVADSVRWLGEHPGDDALAGATPFLQMLGLTIGGWVMAQTWEAAQRLESAEPQRAEFWRAKQTSSRFYLDQILPTAPALQSAVTSGAAALG
ncbi:MAG: acyl-CoA dehydrogenase [Acidimicrobiia bacterium]|nr:acyl-CoA dehydrogenase [Acidimicrobiia bacterium]MYG59179.1 acyl-CoA dehydrogenase [Acidimicrobiia bacterium]MYJ32083.1 acyl-CoA dehydrogenase [Acidimicrobiia bacterium]